MRKAALLRAKTAYAERMKKETLAGESEPSCRWKTDSQIENRWNAVGERGRPQSFHRRRL